MGPWVVFETNTFGFSDREKRVHLIGHLNDPEHVDGLVELLNIAPDMLLEYENLETTKGGITVNRSAQSLRTEIANLRAALSEALDHWEDRDHPRRLELQKLL